MPCTYTIVVAPASAELSIFCSSVASFAAVRFAIFLPLAVFDVFVVAPRLLCGRVAALVGGVLLVRLVVGRLRLAMLVLHASVSRVYEPRRPRESHVEA